LFVRVDLGREHSRGAVRVIEASTNTAKGEHMAVDWREISALEGGRILEGYVPTRIGIRRPNRGTDNWQYYGDIEPTQLILTSVAGSSGVTIATGIDLGSKTSLWLKQFDSTLAGKLTPFLGLARENAVKKLWEKRGVVLTEAEATALDTSVMRAYESSVKVRYNAESKKSAWDLLTGPIQTALTSIHYNHGVIWSHGNTSSTRQLWGLAVGGRWWDAHVLWLSFSNSIPAKDYTRKRRTKREADLLRPKELDLDNPDNDTP
jgi:hypothetical protein